MPGSTGEGPPEGQISDRVMARGFPTPDKKELERLLGRPLGKLVGTSFASSKPTAPFAPCQPRIAVPDGEAAYLLHEVAPRDLVHCRAVDVNDMNAVLGHGNHPDALGGKDAVPWTWTTGDEPRRCGFIGTPRHINSHGEVVGAATVYDGSVHAVRWGPAGLVDLGEKRELHSCATAITDSGLAAGWVSVDVPAKGQLGHRPAAWIDGELVVLRDFGCDWGEAVDANDAGTVLVVGYVGHRCQAVEWNPNAGRADVIDERFPGSPPSIPCRWGTVGWGRHAGKERAKGESNALVAGPEKDGRVSGLQQATMPHP